MRVRVFVGVPFVIVAVLGVLGVPASRMGMPVLLAIMLVLMGMRCVVRVVAHVAPSLFVVSWMSVAGRCEGATQPK